MPQQILSWTWGRMGSWFLGHEEQHAATTEPRRTGKADSEVEEISPTLTHCRQEEPPLRRLPTELRIEIYKYALLERDVVSTDAGWTQPGLLRTC